MTAPKPARARRRHHVLSQGVASVVRGIADSLVLKDGDLFFLCDQDGGVPLHGEHGGGLYHHDCRYLSGYELLLAGGTAYSLAATAAQGDAGVIELTNPDIRRHGEALIPKETVGVTWTRKVDGSVPALFDELVIRRYGPERISFPIELRFAARFEDIFAIRGLWTERLGESEEPRWDDDVLRFLYHGADGMDRGLDVRFDPIPDRRDGTAVAFDVRPGPGEPVSLRLSLAVAAVEGSRQRSKADRRDAPDAVRRDRSPTAALRSRSPAAAPRDVAYRPTMTVRHGSRWLASAASVSSDSDRMSALLDRSLRDLRSLRTSLDESHYIAAGVPWFVALFGRDSLITALQVLAYDPTVAEATLALLAERQGRRHDAWRDEDPGKILHEFRVGEYARVGGIPHTPYYGSVDATPLFVLLVAEHARWTGSIDLFRELRQHVDAALAWIDRSMDEAATGWIEYHSETHGGLVNQGWKDSGNAIINADGSLARPPIAVVEVQGYAFHAKQAIAPLFRHDGDDARADALEAEAADLRERFERDFWVDGDGRYALALQDGGRPCSVRSSNQGHLLWSGIASPDRADATVRMLMASEMFSGWGIRTLASGERGYNPVGYHLGTVWPHDNAIIAAGSRRYGHDSAALRIVRGLVHAALDFDEMRLPEAFAGYPREAYGIPVRYPVACHPQAWAAGSLPFLMTTLAGLEPDGFGHRLRVVRPLMPPYGTRYEFRDLAVGKARARLRFERVDDGARARVVVLGMEGDLDIDVEEAPEPEAGALG